jgi:hypothetical protein
MGSRDLGLGLGRQTRIECATEARAYMGRAKVLPYRCFSTLGGVCCMEDLFSGTQGGISAFLICLPNHHQAGGGLECLIVLFLV